MPQVIRDEPADEIALGECAGAVHDDLGGRQVVRRLRVLAENGVVRGNAAETPVSQPSNSMSDSPDVSSNLGSKSG